MQLTALVSCRHEDWRAEHCSKSALSQRNANDRIAVVQHKNEHLHKLHFFIIPPTNGMSIFRVTPKKKTNNNMRWAHNMSICCIRTPPNDVFTANVNNNRCIMSPCTLAVRHMSARSFTWARRRHFMCKRDSKYTSARNSSLSRLSNYVLMAEQAHDPILVVFWFWRLPIAVNGDVFF